MFAIGRAQCFTVGLVAGVTAALLFQLRRRRLPPVEYLPLARDSLPDCPFELCSRWIAEHKTTSGFLESHAVVLATSSPSGGATARTVILQRWGSEFGGLVFGSQRSSLKGRDVVSDPRAEAVLRLGQRQIRFRGEVRFGSREESRAAFGRLPRGSQIGLQLLRQGEACADEAYAECKRCWRALADADEGGDWRCPDDYVAMILEPCTIEAYSGGHPGYINDRWLWVRSDDGRFILETRLQA
jgi:pyridoxine/pyridoxamine 5'-phosphate oxidase